MALIPALPAVWVSRGASSIATAPAAVMLNCFSATRPADFRRRLRPQEVQAYLAECIKNISQADASALIGVDGIILNASQAEPAAYATAHGFYTYFRKHDDPSMFIGPRTEGRLSSDMRLFFAEHLRDAITCYVTTAPS